MASIQTVSNERVVSLLQEIKTMVLGRPIQDKWMDINKASKYCDVCSQTLRRNIHSGSLKASSTTGKLLFKKSELEKWLTKGEK